MPRTSRIISLNIILIIIAMVIGAAIAVPAARLVKMTAMPQMVAIFNGVGGGAAALVSVTELLKFPGSHVAVYKIGEVLFGVLVGVGLVLRERHRVRKAAGADDRAARSPIRASSR